jgi:hypothetical protein
MERRALLIYRASAAKKGLWDQAASGTLFLVEITEASPAMSAPRAKSRSAPTSSRPRIALCANPFNPAFSRRLVLPLP